MSEVMAPEVAEEELGNIEDFFETLYEKEERAVLLPLVREGRFYCDPDQKRVVFKLGSPLIKMNKEEVMVIRLRKAFVDDVLRINKGFVMDVDSSGTCKMDMGNVKKRDLRAIAVLSDTPIGVVNRLGLQDFAVLSTVINFLD